MKTTYLLQAENCILDINRGAANPYFLDVTLGDYYVGLLSALPTEGKDGWEGAAELYSVPGVLVGGLPGIKELTVTTGGYYPQQIVKASFTLPSITNVPSQSVSAIVTEYQRSIEFPIATADWGTDSVKGLVLYALRGTRIIPLLTVPFLTPKTVLRDRRLVIPNNSTSRLRIIDLIKKNTLN